jgi:hypothetical protein
MSLRIVLALLALSFATRSAQAQPPVEALPPQNAYPQDMIVGENLMVVVGPKHDRIWAYSYEQGSWSKQNLPNDFPGPIVPQVTAHLVVFQAGKRLYAYSAPRGSWSTLNLETPLPVFLQLGPDGAWCREGSKVHAFSAKAGQWSSIDPLRD